MPAKRRITVQSGKAKGRNLQKWVRDRLIDLLGVHPEDVESRSMGAAGEDIIMSRACREKFPFSVECKNVEKINVWDCYKQAATNCPEGAEPLLVFKKNNQKAKVMLDADYFIAMQAKINKD